MEKAPVPGEREKGHEFPTGSTLVGRGSPQKWREKMLDFPLLKNKYKIKMLHEFQ
jgi:hypothetical protein